MSDKKVMTMLERMGMVKKVDEEGEPAPETGALTSSETRTFGGTAVPDDFWDESPKAGESAPTAPPPVSAPAPTAAAQGGQAPAQAQAPAKVSGYTSSGVPIINSTGAIPIGGAAPAPAPTPTPPKPPEPVLAEPKPAEPKPPEPKPEESKPVQFAPMSDIEPKPPAPAPKPVYGANDDPAPRSPAMSPSPSPVSGQNLSSGVSSGMNTTVSPSVTAMPEEPPAVQPIPQAAPAQTYTDRFMEVEDLYSAFSMRTLGTDTIYLVEDYMKTLPDSLPAESRRTIIMKIIGASGFDFDRLLSDGIDRVNKLNEYAGQFAQRTDDYVSRCNSAIDSLEQQMQQVHAQIEKRKALHKQQFFAIETEAQRLKEILDFITK